MIAGLVSAAPSAPAQEEVQPGAPIEYQPFNPDRWKEKKQSSQMTPWEGERVVLLTTRADLDGKTMAVFLKRLDAGWSLYEDIIGGTPAPNRLHNGKPTIAAVPDASYTCGIGCGCMAATGIEVGAFYTHDYALVAQQPDAFPHYYFYEMGRNYYLFGGPMHSFGTGFAVFMRYVCMDALKCQDADAATREAIEKAESRLKDTELTFLQAFTTSAGMGEKEKRLKSLAPSDQPVMYASAMLKLRRDYGGDAWAKRFFHFLAMCPNAGADNSQDSGRAQGLNWLVAASCAAKQDLTELFAERWQLPVGPGTRDALRRIDWKAKGLSPSKLFETIPTDELPLTLAVRYPGFITPERRKGNLLVDGSFEDGAGGHWSVVSWRHNREVAMVQGEDVKQGKKALAIRSAQADHARYTQQVTVKPNTRYLLCGWIKTQDVEVVQKGGRQGANLSLDSGHEATESHVGTQDWTYVTLLFDSGNRSEVMVCARLGLYSSTAKGTAWFDDLVLVELSPPAVPK
jgi:hypothetical protein